MVTQALVGGVQSSLLDGSPFFRISQSLGSHRGRRGYLLIVIVLHLEGIGAPLLRSLWCSRSLVLQEELIIHVIESVHIIEVVVHGLQIIVGHVLGQMNF